MLGRKTRVVWKDLDCPKALNSYPLLSCPALWPVGGAVTDSVWACPPHVKGVGCAAAVGDSRLAAAAPSAGSTECDGELYRDSSSQRCCCALCAGDIQCCLYWCLASVRTDGGSLQGAAGETERNPTQRTWKKQGQTHHYMSVTFPHTVSTDKCFK